MRKSSFVFIIMAAIYFAVAILDGLGWMTITDNILLGLSLSALLSAISDILYNIGWKRTITNEFGYIIQVTLKFLSEKQAHNIPIANPNVNIRGVRQYISGMSKNYNNALRPDEYDKKKFVTAIKICSQIAFILSIASFILLPFLSLPFQAPISKFLTLSAFSAMCLNLYIGEAITDLLNKRNDDFMNKERLIIQTVYPDFIGFLDERLWPDDEIISEEESQEAKIDAHS